VTGAQWWGALLFSGRSRCTVPRADQPEPMPMVTRLGVMPRPCLLACPLQVQGLILAVMFEKALGPKSRSAAAPQGLASQMVALPCPVHATACAATRNACPMLPGSLHVSVLYVVWPGASSGRLWVACRWMRTRTSRCLIASYGPLQCVQYVHVLVAASCCTCPAIIA
jgi:hypothetical protein